MKKLNLEKSIYDLTQEYPELINILKDLGFAGLANPVLRRSVGRITTLPEGCQKHGKVLSEVLEKLKAEGFETVMGGNRRSNETKI